MIGVGSDCHPMLSQAPEPAQHPRERASRWGQRYHAAPGRAPVLPRVQHLPASAHLSALWALPLPAMPRCPAQEQSPQDAAWPL